MRPADLSRQLSRAGYLADEALALVAFLAITLERPLLVEGPPGVGKTDLARALGAALSREVVRLQCYEGLDEAKALYEWEFYAKQMLYTQLLRDSVAAETAGATSLADAADRVARSDAAFFSRRFLIERPLLRALTSERPVVMLIDEVDRSDPEFAALLLEVLFRASDHDPRARQRPGVEPPALRAHQQRLARDDRRLAPPVPARLPRLPAPVPRAGDPRAPRPRPRQGVRRAARARRGEGPRPRPPQGPLDRRDHRLGARAPGRRRQRPRRRDRPRDPRRHHEARGRPRQGRGQASARCWRRRPSNGTLLDGRPARRACGRALLERLAAVPAARRLRVRDLGDARLLQAREAAEGVEQARARALHRHDPRLDADDDDLGRRAHRPARRRHRRRRGGGLRHGAPPQRLASSPRTR